MTTPPLHPDTSIYIFTCVEIARSLTSHVFLYMLNNPEINAVMERAFGGDNREKIAVSLQCNSMPGKSIQIPMPDLMANANMKDCVYNLAFMRRSIGAAIASVHDEIKRRGLDDKKEDMEFLRHIRNAYSHGNRFTFNGDEPKRTAKFMALEITKGLDGMAPVLFDYVMPGDVVILLDSIARRVDPSVAI